MLFKIHFPKLGELKCKKRQQNKEFCRDGKFQNKIKAPSEQEQCMIVRCEC
jgi:hypothetical protein